MKTKKLFMLNFEAKKTFFSLTRLTQTVSKSQEIDNKRDTK